MTYVNLLFSPAAPPPTILTFLDGSSERNLCESVKEVTRGGPPCASPRRNIASSFHIKRLENAALLILLPPFPGGTQRRTLWAEKNATQMTLSLEAEVLPRARYAEAQPITSQCTGVGLSIALTWLSEWERRVTHRHTGRGVCLCVCVCWIKIHPVHGIFPRCQRKCTTGHIGRIVAPLFLTTKPSLSFWQCFLTNKQAFSA